MPASKVHSHDLLERSNGQSSICSTSSPPHGASSALKGVRKPNGQSGPAHVGAQDSSTFANPSGTSRTLKSVIDDVLNHDEDGHSSGSRSIGIEEITTWQQLARPRTVSCNPGVPVRLTIQSNGAPLATIAEQGSYSTLKTYGPLLIERRVLSTSTVERNSPSQISASEGTNYNIDQHGAQVPHLDTMHKRSLSNDNRNTAKRSQESGSISYAANPTPATAGQCPFQNAFQNDLPEWHNTAVVYEDKMEATGFFRSVLQDVRAASRTRSPGDGLCHKQAERSERNTRHHIQTIEASLTTLGQFDSPHFVSPSLHACDHVKSPSRNASFCSTMSTSYSSTVLGIDLDLDHFVEPSECSRSLTSVAPPWFTPHIAELERQACLMEPPKSKIISVSAASRRSITSSALTSLLPIAAASGIVKPYFDTPQISFFSPSGNIIQLDGGLTPTASTAKFCASSAMASPDYSSRTKSTDSSGPERVSLPPLRPALVPMSTPPMLSAPLPAYVMSHHNYRKPEISQIDSTESFVVPAPVVKGCGGIVRSPSFNPRSALPVLRSTKVPASSHRKRHRSIESMIRELRAEIYYYKARIIAAASLCCRSPRTRDQNSDKLITTTHTRHATGHANETRHSFTDATTTYGRTGNNCRSKQVGAFSPLTGYALRVCFCQPYDGAGKPTQDVVGGTSCVNMHVCAATPSNTKQVHETATEVDSDLPNARVVEARSGRKKQKQGATSISGHSRTRSDSVISVGVGLRVAMVGG